MAQQLKTVSRLVHRPLEKDKLNEGPIDIGGPTLDQITLHGLRFDGTTRVISGHPQRSTRELPEILEYVSEASLNQLHAKGSEIVEEAEKLEHANEIKQLEDERASTRSEVRQKKIDEAIAELKKQAENAPAPERLRVKSEAKRIGNLAKGIQEGLKQAGFLNAAVYIFDNPRIMIVHMGHTEFSLVDYAKADSYTGQLIVYGFIQELPEPIDVGRGKYEFAIFDPLDTREVEKGGQLKVTYFSHTERMQLQTWVSKILHFTSYIQVLQKFKTTALLLKQADRTIKDLQSKLAKVSDAYQQLKAEAKVNVTGSLSASYLSFFVSIFGLGGVGLVAGILLSIMLGSSVNTVQQPIYNRNQTLIGTTPVTIQTPNPLIYVLPGMLCLACVLIAVVLQSRHLRGR